MKDADSCSSTWCLAHDVDALPRKMIVPLVTSRMEEIGNLICVGVNTREVRSLMEIAVNAGKGKILKFVRPAMKSRHNMLNVESGER